MNGCFDNQLRAVVFDGVKTSRMLSCQAVTIGRDVRGVASLAWGGVRGTGGDWLVIDHAAQPLPTPSRTCPSSVLNYTVQTAGFVLFLELFVLIAVISRLFGTDYRPTDNRPVRYRCIPERYHTDMKLIYMLPIMPYTTSRQFRVDGHLLKTAKTL